MSSSFKTLRQKTGLSIDEAAAATGYTRRTLYRWENGEAKPRKAAYEALLRICEDRAEYGRHETNFKFIDLFAGIGGLRRGFESIGGSCVFTSEWDKYAQQTYRANNPGDRHEISGDITKIECDSIPEHDVLLAGFPCQPFSIAGVSKKNALGKQHGFRCEAQGTLFFDVARIIDFHKPKVFLLENVKNLVNHDRGNTFRIIRKTLESELGYEIHWRVIDAKYFVPQHRERIFIIGFKNPSSFTFDNFKLPDLTAAPKLGLILHPEDGTEKPEHHFTTGMDAAVSQRYTLTDHLWSYLQSYAEKHRLKGNGFGYGLFGKNDIARTLSARYYKDGSEILVSRPGGNPRRLTPRECARLMGFDKPSESKFVIPVSDTQAYRQFGNSVVVPAVERVAQHLQPHLKAALEGKKLPFRELDLFTSEEFAMYG